MQYFRIFPHIRERGWAQTRAQTCGVNPSDEIIRLAHSNLSNLSTSSRLCFGALLVTFCALVPEFQVKNTHYVSQF